MRRGRVLVKELVEPDALAASVEAVLSGTSVNQRDPEALEPSKGAGSTTLSSDIDVNLKGNHTELAVALFNSRFRKPKKLSAHTCAGIAEAHQVLAVLVQSIA